MSRTAANAEKTVVPAVVPARAALKQQAYSELKRMMLCGDLEAGTVLSVRQLAARLSMRKSPVQAALERLEAEELVTLAPQQGVVVRVMSLQDIINHYEIRQAIEPFVMRRLAGGIDRDRPGRTGPPEPRGISEHRPQQEDCGTSSVSMRSFTNCCAASSCVPF